jgi:hypothetical protein
MAMQQTLAVINAMEAAGIIGRYAIGGAVAAYNYTEAAVTEDLDILVSFDGATTQQPAGLISLQANWHHEPLSGKMNYERIQTRIYADVSEILARKEAGRRDLARLSFGEKIARIEALRERLAPFKRAREMRRATETRDRQSGQ